MKSSVEAALLLWGEAPSELPSPPLPAPYSFLTTHSHWLQVSWGSGKRSPSRQSRPWKLQAPHKGQLHGSLDG